MFVYVSQIILILDFISDYIFCCFERHDSARTCFILILIIILTLLVVSRKQKSGDFFTKQTPYLKS